MNLFDYIELITLTQLFDLIKLITFDCINMELSLVN